MGASGWSYRVPYDDDLDRVLAALQAKVLRDGDYLGWWMPTPFAGPVPDEALAGMLDEVMFDLPGGLSDVMLARVQEDAERIRRREDPVYPDAVRVLAADMGTHSIIDMAGVGADPDWDVVAPLDPDVLERTLGTTQPTPERVEEHLGDIEVMRDYGGTYVVGFTAGEPTDIFFTGISGD